MLYQKMQFFGGKMEKIFKSLEFENRRQEKNPAEAMQDKTRAACYN